MYSAALDNDLSRIILAAALASAVIPAKKKSKVRGLLYYSTRIDEVVFVEEGDACLLFVQQQLNIVGLPFLNTKKKKEKTVTSEAKPWEDFILDERRDFSLVPEFICYYCSCCW